MINIEFEYIRLFDDVVSCVFDGLLVVSLDTCFFGILSNAAVDFFLKN